MSSSCYIYVVSGDVRLCVRPNPELPENNPGAAIPLGFSRARFDGYTPTTDYRFYLRRWSGNVDCYFALPQITGDTRTSSPIVTSGAATARAADTVSIAAPAGSYDLHLVMDDTSEQVINGWTPTDPLPLSLPQGKYITSYYGVAA